tara:strand:+ start:392 stop:3472 length:3081 start_codon:yes stop_codon:yes gene_type:complete
MKRLQKPWMELINLAEGVIVHLLENQFINNIYLIKKPEKKYNWLNTTKEMVEELLPKVKKKKLNKSITFLNELREVVKDIESCSNVKTYKKEYSDKHKHFISTTKKFLKSIPECYNKNVLIGEIYFVQGDYEQSIHYYNKTTDANLFEDMYLPLCICHLLLGNYEQAYNEYLNMARNIQSLISASMSISIHQIRKCITKIENYLAKNPDDIKVLQLKAFLVINDQEEDNNSRETVSNIYKDMEKIISIDPKNILAHIIRFNYLGAVIKEKNDYKKVLKETILIGTGKYNKILDLYLDIFIDMFSKHKGFTDLMDDIYKIKKTVLISKLISIKNILNVLSKNPVIFDEFIKQSDSFSFLPVLNETSSFFLLSKQISEGKSSADAIRDCVSEIDVIINKNNFYSLHNKSLKYLDDENYKQANKYMILAKNILELNMLDHYQFFPYRPLILFGLNKKKKAAEQIINILQKTTRDRNFFSRTYEGHNGSYFYAEQIKRYIKKFDSSSKLKKNELWFFETIYKADPNINSAEFYRELITLSIQKDKYNNIIKYLKTLLDLEPYYIKNHPVFLSSLVNNITNLSITNLCKLIELFFTQIKMDLVDYKSMQSICSSIEKLNYSKLTKATMDSIAFNKYYENYVGDPISQIDLDGYELFILKSKLALIRYFRDIMQLREKLASVYDNKKVDYQIFQELKGTYNSFIYTAIQIMEGNVNLLTEQLKVIDIEEEAKHKIEKMVQQYTHTLSNTLFPNSINDVANSLKKSDNFKKEALILEDVYHSEVLVKRQGQLLQLKHMGNEAGFRQHILGDRLLQNSKENSISIEEIITYSAERIISRFLNQDNQRLADLRETVATLKQADISVWKQSYENKVFFGEKMTAVEWAKDKIGIIIISKHKEWNKIKLIRDNYAQSLLQSYFMELLFNALKYKDHSQINWVTIDFGEEEIKGSNYLKMIVTNPVLKGDVVSVGMGKGLEGIKNDLSMLNSDSENQEFLKLKKNDKQFSVTMYLQKDLFVMPDMEDVTPPWKRKKKV